MVPDAVLRLAAVQKALEDIIRPVLPKNAGFAQEQLELIIKSIALVRKQIPHEYAVHVHDAHAFADFGRDLAPLLPQKQRATISEAIARVEAVAPAETPDRIALENSVRSLRSVIESAISEAACDRATLDAIGPIVLAHTERQTLLERLWVADTGFDPAPDSLPTIEQALFGAPKEKEKVITRISYADMYRQQDARRSRSVIEILRPADAPPRRRFPNATVNALLKAHSKVA